MSLEKLIKSFQLYFFGKFASGEDDYITPAQLIYDVLLFSGFKKRELDAAIMCEENIAELCEFHNEKTDVFLAEIQKTHHISIDSSIRFLYQFLDVEKKNVTEYCEPECWLEELSLS